MTVKGTEFTFVNEFRKNKSGFSHHSDVYQNSVKVGTAKAKYENRTWENYEFQTSMKRAVDAAIANEESELIEEYKRKEGKSRVKAEDRKWIIANNPTIDLLLKLRESL